MSWGNVLNKERFPNGHLEVITNSSSKESTEEKNKLNGPSPEVASSWMAHLAHRPSSTAVRGRMHRAWQVLTTFSETWGALSCSKPPQLDCTLSTVGLLWWLLWQPDVHRNKGKSSLHARCPPPAISAAHTGPATTIGFVLANELPLFPLSTATLLHNNPGASHANSEPRPPATGLPVKLPWLGEQRLPQKKFLTYFLSAHLNRAPQHSGLAH